MKIKTCVYGRAGREEHASALRSHADSDQEDSQSLLSIKGYDLASTDAMRHVTFGCDQQTLRPQFFRTLGGPGGQFRRVLAAGDAVYLLLDICANLTYCDESADFQAFPANAAEK